MTNLDTQDPSAVLKAEHQVILRVLKVLRRLINRFNAGEGFERESLAQCVEFFRSFADACHHAKEEELLFPTLEAKGIPRDGGPIGCMLEEHRQARVFTAEMGDAIEANKCGSPGAPARFVEAADQYIDLLTNHIYKEDNILFAMGDRVMSDEDQSALREQFCAVGCRKFGGRNREELEQIADALEVKWPAD